MIRNERNIQMKNKIYFQQNKHLWFCTCILTIALLSGCGSTESVRTDITLESSALVESGNTVSVESPVSEAQNTLPVAVVSAEEPVEETPEAPAEYKIIMVGDVLLHTPVERSCRQADGSYDYDSLFEHTKDEISAADLALVNQEVIIGGADLGISGYPCFNADFQRLYASYCKWSK